ncbi:glycosyltransferase family 2 protein [Weissella paramesenteroides]|uniref:glycosyltransferase family 2 protein n=1 Tax=Weissella paramesenteroides TaxID=1249 RepID=UPI00223BE106|nr:glycosyltransferase family 2 protein [Weissella paramesenteroides]MCT0484740.1 glycosyltransferase family 2 protein [Weissella paramesenteroides]
MNYKISIIINTFNVVNYIRYTLLSVIPQLTNEMELIIIDDNSTDNTVEEIRNLVPNYDNIRFVKQVDNIGISAERNYGILNASGKYILFIDGDDYIAPETLGVLSNIVKIKDYDLVGYNMESVPDYVTKKKLNSREKNYVSTDLLEGVYDREGLLDNLFKNKLKHNPVTYLFKREIFLNNKLFFPNDINYGEDYGTIYKFFSHVEQGRIINKRLYKYVQRSSSATHVPNLKYAQDNLLVSNEILDYFKDTKYYSGSICYVIPRLITALSIATKVKPDTSKVVAKEIENEIRILSTKKINFKDYLSYDIRLKVYLNNLRLLKYIFYYKGILDNA